MSGPKRVTLNGLVQRVVGSMSDDRRAVIGPILRRNGWVYFAIGIPRNGKLHTEYVSVGRRSAVKQRDEAIAALRRSCPNIIEAPPA
jgi:hypothetical protein